MSWRVLGDGGCEDGGGRMMGGNFGIGRDISGSVKAVPLVGLLSRMRLRWMLSSCLRSKCAVDRTVLRI